MQALRTLACATVVLVAVAWLVRVPTSPAEPDDPPTTEPSPYPADPEEDLPGDREAQEHDPTPVAGADLVDDSRLLAVHRLDPKTLDALSAEPIAFTAGPVVAIDSGEHGVLLGTQALPQRGAVQLLRTTPLTKPGGWVATQVPDGDARTWLAIGERSVAWVTPGGWLHVTTAGTAWVTARRLPDGHEVIDGGFVDGDVLLLATRDPGSAGTLGMMTWDLTHDEIALHAVRTDHVVGTRLGRRGLLHVVDQDVGIVHVLDTSSGVLLSIDVRGQETRTSVLPGHAPGVASAGGLGLTAGHGLVVIHGRPTGDAGPGTIVMRADHGVVAIDDQLRLQEVALGLDGVLLARADDGRVVVVGPDLRASAPIRTVGLATRPVERTRLIGSSGDTGYIQTPVNGGRALLQAVDLDSGEVTASHITRADAVFVPDGALLLTPVT